MNTIMKFAGSLIRTRHIYWGIFAAAFCFYLFFSHLLSITDPVESNYALTAKEMVQTSDWISPRIYGNVWFDKPVFFYWLTAASFKIFGFSDLAARLVPAFFGAAGLVFIYWYVSKISTKSAALIAAMIMGTSLEYVILAKLVITDMVFLVFNSTALAFFYLGYIKMNGTRQWYFGMYVSLALAALTKGPIGVLLPGLVMTIFIVMQRNWSEFKKMSIPLGALLFAAITLPWYLAMYAMHGADFLNVFLGVHNYLRATVSEHPKDNVSYYYIIVFFLSMLPWSAIAIQAIIRGYQNLRSKSYPLILFCLIWAFSYFGFYSLMATKYITYIFPILFPVSILTALYLDQVFAQGKTKTVVYWGGIPLVLLLAGYMAISVRYLEGYELTITISSLLVLLLFTAWKAKGRDAKQIFGIFCLCQAAALIILSIFVFPQITDSRSGKTIANTISEHQGYRVGLYQFYSTSAVYYSGNLAVKLQSTGPASLKQSGTLSWSSKYSMPVKTAAEFMAPNTKETLIVVPDEKREQFSEETKNFEPKLLKSSAGYSYYYLNN